MTKQDLRTASTVTDAAQAGQVIEHVDPSTLLVDRNIRQDLNLTKAFLASVKDQGVLVPLTVVRTVDGDLRVRFGGRRTAAAVEVGRETVPVIIVADESTDDAATVERLVSQYAENEHRSGLTSAERLATVEQMSLLGVSAAQITKRLRAPRAEVDAALAVSGSTLAKAATARYDFLDLTQAAVVAEFEDYEEAVKALVAAARSGQFAHVAQRLRDERSERERRQAIADDLRASGVTVIDPPKHADAPTGLSSLVDVVDGDRQVLTVEGHAECPGHCAWLTDTWAYVNPRTGQPMTDEDYEAFEAENAVNAVSAASDDQGEGAHEIEAEYARVTVAAFGCIDPRAHGHQDRYTGGQSSNGKPKAADMSDEQREAAKAERKDVIDSNKAWRSAETVRREWLSTFLSRKTAPKTAGRFLATSMASADHALTQALTDGHAMAATLLGLDGNAGFRRSSVVHQAVIDATDARAQVLHLALVLGAYEAATGTHSWRNVNPTTQTYLTWIAANGYTLAPVERRACGLPVETTGVDADNGTDEATADSEAA